MEKTQITKEQFNKLVESNFTSGQTMELIDHLEFLRGAYKMKEKQILNNVLKQLHKMLKMANFNEDQNAHLQSIADNLHDSSYEVKKEYRKEMLKHFEIVG